MEGPANFQGGLALGASTTDMAKGPDCEYF